MDTHREIEEQVPRGLTRRRVLGTGLTGAAIVGMGQSLVATGQSSVAPQFPSKARRRDGLRVLVNRITQGLNTESLAEARQMGFQGYLDWQLDYENIDDSAMDAMLAQYPTLSMTTDEIFHLYMDMDPSPPVPELRKAKVLRSIFSKRQLFERMVELWTDHFNIDINDMWARILKTSDDRDVIRAHAMGKFPDLLHASSRSGAMLFFLDNYTNNLSAPNENYARELMELHSVGVNGPYTENDIRELARALTGWGLAVPTEPNTGDFFFFPDQHDDGPKSLLGLNLPAGLGVNDGVAVVNHLANSPATAAFVAGKICKWLLSYDPPQYVIDRVTQTYLWTGGDIKEMIRATLTQAELGDETLAAPKLRRPFHFVTSLVRASGATVTDPAGLLAEIDILAHPPFSWPAADGFPDTLEAWGSSVLPRWEFASRFFANEIPGVNVSFAQLATLVGSPIPPSELAAAIDVAMTGGGGLSHADIILLQSFVDAQPGIDTDCVRETFALAASSPSFQLY